MVVFIMGPAWGQPSHTAQLIEGAKKEGKLVWFTTMAVDTSQPLVNAFLKEYPFIKAELVRATGERIISRILSETAAGKWSFDVVSGGDVDLLADRNLLLSYVSPESAAIPSDVKEPHGRWTSLYNNHYVLAYYTKMVSERDAPKQYGDLLEPKWKGKIIINATSYDWYGMLVTVWGKDRATQYMRRLAAQQPIWHRSYGLIAQLLGAGEAALGWAYSFRIERMKKDGAPVDWVSSFDPILQNVTGIGISAKPNNPNTARLFIDFVLSKKGQEMIRDMLRVPGRSDVKPLVSKMDPARLKLKQAPREVFIHFDQYAKEFREIFGL